ncbi:MAG: excinuclease ABC subunit UvrC [Rickettsiales bacterium]|jgi:excinuclease ABC subunit C|nr:excinuclease ABC subunit UvrC [Rickettsiales bacterium]
MSKGVEIVREFWAAAPEKPGVYRMFGADGRVLYVGKAKNLKNRIKSYTDPARLSDRIAKMVSETASMKAVETLTENEALILEQDLIHQLRPKYNIIMRDDKSYPFLTISRDDFPRLGKFRGIKNSRLRFFGPFPSGLALNEGIKIIQAVFKLRTCADAFFRNRRTPCLLYQIKKCSAPCCGRISRDAYAASAAGAVRFLEGKSDALVEDLAARMDEASGAKEYEDAIFYRNQIEYLNQILKRSSLSALPSDTDIVCLVRRDDAAAIEVLFSRNSIIHGDFSYALKSPPSATDAEILSEFLEVFYAERDVPKLILANVAPPEGFAVPGARIEVPSRGDKRSALDTVLANGEAKLARRLLAEGACRKYIARLAEIFGLAQNISRIDLFDNSHISGTSKVGAMVVAGPEGFRKDDYRLYNIKTVRGGDDFAMMEEVLTRRYARAISEGALPDLVIVDGGKIQVEFAHHALARLSLDIPIIGIAKTAGHDKGNETLYMFGGKEVRLEPNDPLLFFLERIRDESHRFAVSAHRRRREKSAVSSQLDAIEGIGEAKKKALLRYFGSVRNIINARVEEISRVEGISGALAKKIYAEFH